MMRLHGRARKSGNETTISAIGLILIAVAGFASEVLAQPPQEVLPLPPQAGVATVEDNRPAEPLLAGPAFGQSAQVPAVQVPQPTHTDQVLPINLATALYLSNGRPLVIASAQASVELAAAQYQGTRVLWLPDLHFGLDWYHHEGAIQATSGAIEFDSFSGYGAGGGLTMNFGVTDAIFQPLAARQQLSAREWDVQTARNDAMLGTAQSYFDVQEARGRLAGVLDTAVKSEKLVKRVESLAGGLVPGVEVDRAKALLADLNAQAAVSRTNWRVASARLARVLRLNPGSVAVPLEPPHLQITLIAPQFSVDDLIPCGLMNRPELASQRAAVQATLELLRQERLRPLLPSVVLEGSGPGGTVMGGVFGGGQGGSVGTSGGRTDVSAGLVWTLNNLGLGNRALIRARAADQEKALIELFNIQDQVAQEVVQAHAQVEGARVEILQAETSVKEANITFLGMLEALSQTRGVGDSLQLVVRPQEAVAALQQLNQAYDQYFIAIASYNRAQFQLFHALGYPSRILAWERARARSRQST